MSKQTMKEILNEKLNDQGIHDQLLKKITRRQREKKVLFLGLCIFVFVLPWLIQKETSLNKEETKIKEEQIYRNQWTMPFESTMDVAGSIKETTYEEELRKTPELQKWLIPSNLKPTCIENWYDTEGKQYGTSLTYVASSKYLKIFFSTTVKQQPTCTPLPLENLKPSTIAHTSCYILQHADEYYILFSKETVNYEVYAQNIPEEELILFVKSILQPEGEPK